MKKLLAISSVLFGVVFLAGCSQQPVSQTQPIVPTPITQKPTSAVDKRNLVNTFTDEVLGYEIKYPEGWNYEKAKKDNLDLIAFSFKNEPKDKYIVVGLKVLKREGVMDYGVTDFVMKNKYENDILTLDKNAKIYDEKDFTYNFSDSTTSIGRAFKAEYIDSGMKVKKWMIIVPSGKKLFMFDYEADTNNYDLYYDIATGMLDSWKITK